SGKRQPIPLSSRFKNIKTNGWRFTTPSEAEVKEMLRRTVFWVGHKMGQVRVNIADETNAVYVATRKSKLLDLGLQLAAEGWIEIDGHYAVASQKMLGQAAQFEKDEQEALALLQQKHAFESAHKG